MGVAFTESYMFRVLLYVAGAAAHGFKVIPFALTLAARGNALAAAAGIEPIIVSSPNISNDWRKQDKPP